MTAITDISGCSVCECGTCDAQASSYLGSGRMTEVIRLALYTEVLGPWDSDCAGGWLLSKETGVADLLQVPTRHSKHLSSVDYFLVWLYLYMSIIHSDKWRQGQVCQFLSFISKLNDSIQQSTFDNIGDFQVYSGKNMRLETGRQLDLCH